jgi:hypothetical protein
MQSLWYAAIHAQGRKISHQVTYAGYMYCSSHANLTALMPRPGPSNGFDPAEVCSWCIEYLMSEFKALTMEYDLTHV